MSEKIKLNSEESKCILKRISISDLSEGYRKEVYQLVERLPFGGSFVIDTVFVGISGETCLSEILANRIEKEYKTQHN